MTDLTTMHLKCLLEKATPGPWEAEDLSFCECCIDVKAPAGLICTADMDDAPLIAHAPALAEEVIRLREELIDWANDEARAHNALVKRAQEAGGAGIISTHKTIYNRIWEIIGDHND